MMGLPTEPHFITEKGNHVKLWTAIWTSDTLLPANEIILHELRDKGKIDIRVYPSMVQVFISSSAMVVSFCPYVWTEVCILSTVAVELYYL